MSAQAVFRIFPLVSKIMHFQRFAALEYITEDCDTEEENRRDDGTWEFRSLFADLPRNADLSKQIFLTKGPNTTPVFSNEYEEFRRYFKLPRALRKKPKDFEKIFCTPRLATELYDAVTVNFPPGVFHCDEWYVVLIDGNAGEEYGIACINGNPQSPWYEYMLFGALFDEFTFALLRISFRQFTDTLIRLHEYFYDSGQLVCIFHDIAYGYALIDYGENDMDKLYVLVLNTVSDCRLTTSNNDVEQVEDYDSYNFWYTK